MASFTSRGWTAVILSPVPRFQLLAFGGRWGSAPADPRHADRRVVPQGGTMIRGSLFRRIALTSVAAGTAVAAAIVAPSAQAAPATAGLTAKLVTRNASTLNGIVATLNRHSDAVGTAWGVDTAANQVVVTVTPQA